MLNYVPNIFFISGLVLVDEPFFLEPGFEGDRNTDRGKRDSRPYNESVILHSLEVGSKKLRRLCASNCSTSRIEIV